MAKVATIDYSVFLALGDPTRLKIVEKLKQQNYSVGALAEALGVRQPQISKHLRVLSASGLVKASVEHRYRIYALESEGFEALAHWTESFESLWVDRLSNLDAVLAKQKQQNVRKK